MTEQDAEAVLDFWFVEHGSKDWFRKSEPFDESIRQRFLILYESLAHAVPSGWLQAPSTCLAAVLCLDQFPRNLFRGQPQAYATDAVALKLARHALARGLIVTCRCINARFSIYRLSTAKTWPTRS